MKIFIPKSLNLHALFAVNPPKFKYEMDVFYYLIYYIIQNPFFSFNKRTVYVSLCSSGLQNKVHRDYNLYLDHLIELEIINSVKIEDKGKCRLYRLGFDFMYDELETYNITYFPIKRKAKMDRTNKPSTIRKYHHLTKFLLDGKLSFDSILANYNVQNSFREVSSFRSLNNLRKYHFTLFTIKHFQEDYKWVVNNPKKDNRLHTNITNMPKELRQYLKYDGKSLVGIDIKNSQPIMLILLIRNLRNTDDNSVLYGLIQSIIPSHVLINLVKTAESLDITDLNLYEKLVLEGRIYEYLGKEYTIEYGVKEPYIHYEYDETTGVSHEIKFDVLRDFMKVKTFEIFFSSNRKNSKFKKLFAKLFPSLSKLITEIKEDDYKLLSKLMQQIESFIVLENITRGIYADFKIPQFTIHDSVATTPENHDMLKSEFKKRFFHLTGIVPPLETQDWSDETCRLFKNAV